MLLDLWFAGEPVAKGRPRATVIAGRARLYTPANTRKHESALRYAIAQEWGERAPFDEPVSVTISVYLPIPKSFSKRKRDAAINRLVWPAKRPDLDNFMKAVWDSMNGVVIRDDAQIVHAETWKLYGERPGIHIMMTTPSMEGKEHVEINRDERPQAALL